MFSSWTGAGIALVMRLLVSMDLLLGGLWLHRGAGSALPSPLSGGKGLAEERVQVCPLREAQHPGPVPAS